MGYGLSKKGHYQHPDRQAIFVGDYIDRGKHSKEVVQLVRAMQENGSAIALMGNHEYNAICFHTKGSTSEYLRARSNQNIKQHCATLHSFEDDAFLNESLDWFKQLPLFFENEYFRVVHACWDAERIEVLKDQFNGEFLLPELLELSIDKNSPLYEAIELLLKGQEMPLIGTSFLDKDGHERRDIRVKWWEDPKGKTYKEYAVNEFDPATEEKLNIKIPHDYEPTSIYPKNEKPVFYGHYWLEADIPKLQSSNVCCLDYSVAKEGKLMAYRFDGEDELSNSKFIW